MIGNVKNCTGCGACISACGKDAITMQRNRDGFYNPVIDEKKCVGCEMCSKSCHVLNSVHKNAYAPGVFAVRLRDTNALKESASGGAFTAFARQIIGDGGIVFGVRWSSDFRSAEFCTAESEAELEPMRSSKYVQSLPADYRLVKRYLDEGRKVLFTGVPCQIGGLYGYLMGKEYDNLYTAEIVCHGGGSPSIFESSIDAAAKQEGSSLISMNQTSKPTSKWSLLIPKVTERIFDDGRTVSIDSSDEPYMYLYLKALLYNDCCYECKYARMPRTADITMADFFGFGTVRRHKFNTDYGISMVMTNNEHGAELFERAVHSDIVESEPCELEECLLYNHNLWRPCHKPALRKDIFELYHSQGFEAVAYKYHQTPKRKVITAVRRMIKGTIGHKNTARLMKAFYKSKGIDKQVELVVRSIDQDHQ